MENAADLQGATTTDGRYALHERLGNGNFGTVYRGRDLWLERDVAVKLLDPEEVTLDAVLTEARIQNLCQHPHVVTIYDIRIGPPLPMIVMDYLPAGSAEDRLRGSGAGLPDALRWTRNALQGLAHAHEIGVLHRDLKPANLMLLSNGEAALSDFGIAEDTIRNRVATDKHYWPLVAPELLDRKPTSRQSDIWAMGCLLYRLLTSDWPFSAPADIAAGKYEPPQRVNPQVTRAVSRIVAHALAGDLSKRYASARDMLSALSRCKAECAWTRQAEADSLEAWTTLRRGETIIARVLARARAGFEVEVLIDKGSRARRARPNERFVSEAQARQRLATVMRNVVEGEVLR
jgi:serine/threonine protein kinase